MDRAYKEGGFPSACLNSRNASHYDARKSFAFRPSDFYTNYISMQNPFPWSLYVKIKHFLTGLRSTIKYRRIQKLPTILHKQDSCHEQLFEPFRSYFQSLSSLREMV
jgi:hypothetical protein